MSDDSDSAEALNLPLAGSDELGSYISQSVKPLISRLRDLLEELDELCLPKAAAYLSMAIDLVEAELASESD